MNKIVHDHEHKNIFFSFMTMNKEMFIFFKPLHFWRPTLFWFSFLHRR